MTDKQYNYSHSSVSIVQLYTHYKNRIVEIKTVLVSTVARMQIII